MIVLTSRLRCLLVAEAERARDAVDANWSAISWWDRAADVLRTLVNTGHLLPGEERFPEDETYPLDTFPAVAALLREGRRYLDPSDVSSVAVAMQQRYGTHAGVPIVVEGERWGELWVARGLGRPALTGVDLDRLELVAGRLGDALAPYV
jgi:GAF domain-containing protein